MESTFLNKDSSNRTFTFIKLSLNYKTSCFTVRICFEFTNFCCKQDHLKKSIDSFSCVCRYRNEDCASAPVFRNQFILGKFLFYTFDICTWFINLVDGNDDLNTCCFCMADSLYSLRHYTIICCYDQNCDICGVCTTHTHGCKSFMSRCIQECDLLTVNLYYRSTDMLCDTAGLAACYVCLTDCIQKRCFTMIDMTHNTDYRWSRNHIFLVFFVLFEEFFDDVHFLFFFCDDIVIQSDLLSFLKVDLMVYSNHHTFHEEFLNDH